MVAKGLRVRLESVTENFPDILLRMQRGVEKEGLRVGPGGLISQTDHPAALGCTLTHPHITTDYAESLLELITPVCRSAEELLAWLEKTHHFVHQNMAADEVLWNASMPCRLQGEKSVRIAEYGSSNLGNLKHVYRKGLEVRYGRLMQSIAGVHYNWSMDDEFWRHYAELLHEPDDGKDFRSRHYFGLIRNFRRWSWLLMYLFGASPALDKSFLRQAVPGLSLAADDHTCIAKFATSLRMGDLGYKNDAQSGLFVCFNHLDTYVRTLHTAMHTKHPPYEKIGVKRDGEFIQLNTNILQIENEYYNSIRPKRVSEAVEKPLQALIRRGVQYVEVRCLDINPFAPLGIDAAQVHFLDVFLLTCLLAPSPLLNDTECQSVQQNFNLVVASGRSKRLSLLDESSETGEVPLYDLASSILDHMQLVAEKLDLASGAGVYGQSILWARQQVNNPDQIRSAQLQNCLADSGLSWVDWVCEQSAAIRDNARRQALPDTEEVYFRQLGRQSWEEEAALRLADNLPFEEYLRQFLL
jgi:glutamate--cysteine ligase